MTRMDRPDDRVASSRRTNNRDEGSAFYLLAREIVIAETVERWDNVAVESWSDAANLNAAIEAFGYAITNLERNEPRTRRLHRARRCSRQRSANVERPC